MRGGGTRELPAFDDIEEQLGYNPARFLHTQSPDGHTPLGDTSELAMAQALIRGIDDVDTIHAWREVETALGRGQNGEPRQRVSNWLDQRLDVLQDTQPSPNSRAHEHESPSVEPTEADAAGTSQTTQQDNGLSTASGDETDEESATAGGATASDDAMAHSEAEPVADPICTTCGEDLSPEEIAGESGYWCPSCSNFQEPATTASPAETTDHGEPALAADGGSSKPSTTPRCPDCRGKLTREEAGDEVAFWCSPCGGFREPLQEGVSTEATA